DAHRLSDASQPSLRPVSSASPAPVKGVLGLTQQTRKQKIQEIREKLKNGDYHYYINKLIQMHVAESSRI
uniref:hypothetical protein n=1 Tax=uncultured Ruegeria sp. TaxID=259304 RepID=UPI0026312F7B